MFTRPEAIRSTEDGALYGYERLDMSEGNRSEERRVGKECRL